MFNFDELPDSAGDKYPTPVPDVYKAKVLKSTMKSPTTKNEDGTPKKDYLMCEYELVNRAGTKFKMWDKFFDSEAQPIQFKMGRLNAAAKLNLTGDVTLPDIGRILNGREFVVDAKLQDGSTYLEADIFNDDIYWPIEEFEEVWAQRHPDEAPLPFDEGNDTPDTTPGPTLY